MIKKLFFGILILGGIFCFSPVAQAQMFSETKRENKSFRLKPGTQVQVFNKYGNVNVLVWEKDSVRFEVSITAQSKQQARVNKILSSIDCEMVSAAGFISARTVFNDNSATFWKDVVSYAGKVINAGNNLQINYTVYLPAASPVKIENKFGNIYLGSHKQNADINLSNGDLQARDFAGTFKLKLEFGSATIQEAVHGQFEINYSDVSVQQVTNLSLNSRSSNLDIDKVTNLEINSVRDKINIRNCSSLDGDASFSRIRINTLESGCTMNTRYGDLKLNGISKNFRHIYVRSEYTDLVCSFSNQAAYSIDLSYDPKTTLNMPGSIDNQFKREVVNATTGAVKARAEIGHAGSSQVTLLMKAGSLTLLNK